MKKRSIFITFLMIITLLITSCDISGKNDKVDKSSLSQAVSVAHELMAASTVGEDSGNVPQSAYNTYALAIEAAQAVINNKNANKGVIDPALQVLAEATLNFNSSVIIFIADTTPLTSAITYKCRMNSYKCRSA